MYVVDLNSDIGESFGRYNLGLDHEVLKYITSANIACGFHAGDPNVMDETIKLAKENNVHIGAHPGYLDLIGFGRRNMDISPKEVRNYVVYQLGALIAMARAHNIEVRHVKPHGAMYNMAAKDEKLAYAIAKGIYEVDRKIILMGLAGSILIKMGEEVGLRVCNEVFADRAYNRDATLVSRNLKGAVIHDTDKAIKRVIRMIKESKVQSIDGKDILIKAQSICVHGDNPKALDFVCKIRNKLEEEAIIIKPIDEFIK